ncbi:member of major facilitator superfamily multidrug-resistance, DHA1 sub-family [Tricholoma matsutake]|nr:member of major facilitator superfamily multidrug-resistance, DHA1 sub-family [Tricholoma matsutake 945]
MSPQVDEESPLLSSQQVKKPPTPLPWFQFSIVLFLQLAEPLTSQVIYPFAPELIRDIGITHGNESQVGYYVGLMQSLFFLTQAFTVLHWSSASDRVGRKPVILIGLSGLSMSMYCFGISRSFWALVMSRSLNGALNGNIGVMKSMMAEMTDSTNIAQAYAYMPIAWSTGGTLGPIIGGSLSRPADRFPSLFGNNEFLKKYPYFLPCAVPATYTALAWVITFLFLKETNPVPVPFSRLFKSRPDKPILIHQKVAGTQESSISKSAAPVTLRSLLTPRVIIAAGNYASLSLVDIAFRAIQPLFFSTPIELGGLGMSPSTIGQILSVYGILNGIFQVLFFARIHEYWGSKKVFTVGIASAFPALAAFPLMSYVAKSQGLSATVWAIIAFQTVISIGLNLSYGAIFIFIAAASPSRGSLGATNGLSQMTVSIMRAIGPAAANSLFAMTVEKNYLGGYLVYYVLVAVVCGAMVVASQLPRRLWGQ